VCYTELTFQTCDNIFLEYSFMFWSVCSHHHHHFIRSVNIKQSYTAMQYSGAGQQGPRTLTAARKRSMIWQQCTSQSINITKKIRKLEKSTLAILDLKTDNFEKFTVDGNAFQTLITRSTKKLFPEARFASGLKQFILVTSCTTSNTKLEKVGEVYTD